LSGQFQRIGARLLELAYPLKCPLCGRLGESPCAACIAQFEPHDPPVEFFDEGTLTFRASLYRYRALVADAVKALKYSRQTGLAEWMSAQIAAAPDALGLEYDCVAPIPIHWTRRAHRGFNQSELLAQRLPARLDLLMRVRRTPPQVGLSRSERQKNLEGAFEAAEAVRGKRILLVDDVLTSGSTARECAKALHAKGAIEVGILTFAGEPFG
jgi:ComF family protein